MATNSFNFFKIFTSNYSKLFINKRDEYNLVQTIYFISMSSVYHLGKYSLSKNISHYMIFIMSTVYRFI